MTRLATIEEEAWFQARCEHAWRLRNDGLTLRKIGERLGLSKERSRQLAVIGSHGGRRSIDIDIGDDDL